jgi:hypothetical protein
LSLAGNTPAPSGQLALFRQPQAGRSGDARRLTRRVGAEIAPVRAEMVTARLVGALGHV